MRHPPICRYSQLTFWSDPVQFKIFLTIVAILIHTTAWSAPPKPRPLAGVGLLSIQNFSGQTDTPQTLTIYREPGVGRIADLELAEFPSMAPSISLSPMIRHIAVTRWKTDWAKVIFDDSGREGWLKVSHAWKFQPWQRYLKGGEVRLLIGLRKEYYQLRPAPLSSQTLAPVSKEKKLRVVDIDDNWMLIIVDFENSGWLRWKDDDGRLLITVEK